MRLEDRLRELPAGFDGATDPDASLDAVIAAGRRKRVWRAAGATGAVAVVVAAVAAVALGASPQGPSIQPVGPAPTTSGASEASPSPSEPTPTASAHAVSPAPPEPTPTGQPSEQPSDEPIEDDFPEREWPLELSVRTDRSEYAVGDPVTITVEACNTSDEPHEEYFFEEGDRYDIRILTDDRRAIAYTSNSDGEGGATTEVWAPGECRSWDRVWDQSEGDFDEDDGAQAQPGDYTARADWHGVEPPPPGMDPRLYDPAGRGAVAESPVFTILAPSEPPLVPTEGP